MLQTIEGACALYYYVKIENPDVPWAKELTNALSKFSRKDLLKEKYPPIYRYFQEKKISDPKGYSNQLNSVIRNQKQIIQDLNSLSEFNESVNQGVAEAPGAETLGHNQSTVASNEKAFDLEEGKPREKEADYGADYQDMVSRVKKLAGLGPLKTVYDPQKRVYKNVPTAVQPKKEQR
jgi:hypothetical protein